MVAPTVNAPVIIQFLSPFPLEYLSVMISCMFVPVSSFACTLPPYAFFHDQPSVSLCESINCSKQRILLRLSNKNASVFSRRQYNLQKRLREYQKDHLFFLTHPEVDYTNNVSERGLRKFKRKQKQAVVLRSDSGGRHVCDALTVIETARLQKKDVYDTIKSAFAKG